MSGFPELSEWRAPMLRCFAALWVGVLLSSCAGSVRDYPIQEGQFSLDLPEGWKAGEYDNTLQAVELHRDDGAQGIQIGVNTLDEFECLYALLGILCVEDAENLDALAENARQRAESFYELQSDTYSVYRIGEVERITADEREVRRFALDAERVDASGSERSTLYLLIIGKTAEDKAVFAVLWGNADEAIVEKVIGSLRFAL